MFKKILLAYDGSGGAKAALKVGIGQIGRASCRERV